MCGEQVSAKLKNSSFHAKGDNSLGHHINKSGLEVDKEKVKMIRAYLFPPSSSNLEASFGMLASIEASSKIFQQSPNL